jgi:hypothetical protein
MLASAATAAQGAGGRLSRGRGEKGGIVALIGRAFVSRLLPGARSRTITASGRVPESLPSQITRPPRECDPRPMGRGSLVLAPSPGAVL